jgi:hypothetical protein
LYGATIRCHESTTTDDRPLISRGAPDKPLPKSYRIASPAHPKVQTGITYSVSFDHQIKKTTTVSLSYTGARGYSLFRSRDINAPLPPLYLTRPDPAYGAIRQVESNGRQNADSFGVTLRGRMTAWFNGQVQYTLSRTYNDTVMVTRPLAASRIERRISRW